MKTTTHSTYLLILALSALHPLKTHAADLIVNATRLTITNGNYNTLVVKNSGVLNAKGTLTVQHLTIATAGVLNASNNVLANTITIDGTANITGNVRCSNFTALAGITTVRGTNNSVTNLNVIGKLTGLGTWNVGSLVVSSGGAFQVRANNPRVPKSGTLFIHANTVHVETGGAIDGNYAGNDPRGKGHDSYKNSAGGGHGGKGGRGTVGASSGENVGQAFGSPSTYESFMGGASGEANGGGVFGGGGIFIEAEERLTLDGDILSNGKTPPGSYTYTGGGAGGGITISSPEITLNGKLSANGGNGGYYAGGGGGGMVKIFYEELLGNLTGHISVLGGRRGGGTWTEPGQPGKIYRDFIPRVQTLIAPASGASVTNGSLVFRFTVEDLSQTLDGRLETITPVIELSRDGFQTIAYRFNLDERIAGWNKTLYYSGDTVEYTPQTPIQVGVYAWRVTVRDRSLYSRYSTPQSMAVETTIPGPMFSLDAFMTPAVFINGTAGIYRIDWTSSLNPPVSWNELVTLATSNTPTYYFDLSGVGQPKRFYRAELLR